MTELVSVVSGRKMKVLLVSLAFPPKQDAEVLQTAKLHKYLSALPDTDVHVVTSAETESLRALIRPRVVGGQDVTRFELFTNRYVNYGLLRFLPAFASRPDIKRAAIGQAQAICAALPWRPDIIVSRSYPISSALLGQGIAEKLGVPWILQLSDPWSLSPLHPTGYDLDWNRARESAAFARAGRITFTSTRTMANYARAYPDLADRMRYFPNTYDPEQNRPNPWVRGDMFRLVYTGTLGGTRRPDPMCQAIEALFSRNPDARTQVKFVIAGHADRATRGYLAAKPDYVDWRGPVSFAQSMELIRQADVLTLIDNQTPAAARLAGGYEFFPSKLLDYMLGQRPILGVSESGSLASTVMENLGLGTCYTHAQIDALSHAIEAKWRAWQANSAADFDIRVQDDTYDARAMAQRLRHEMEELVHDR
jgi:hypothetical protein